MFKIYENLGKVVVQPSQEDISKGIIRYGENNSFPLRLALLVQNSPTASSCIATFSEFLAGADFSDKTLKNKIINAQGMRFIEFHNAICNSYATFEGFAINVKYNLKGEITELYPVAFETCRLGAPNKSQATFIKKIKVNPNFGNALFRQQDTQTYDIFAPSLAPAQMKKEGPQYGGQILWVGNTGPLSPFYPAPKYYSAAHWMAIDEAIGGFHEHHVNNGFFQTVMLKLFGDPNQPSNHTDDMTWDATANTYVVNPKFTKAMRFEKEMQKFSGWQKAGNVMAIWADLNGQHPEVTPFPFQDNSNLYRTLQDITTEQIARATRVPSILANIQSGATLGGDGNQIRASVKLMQSRVIQGQDIIKSAYMKILPLMKEKVIDVNFIPYNPFPEETKVDPLQWAALTLDEKRQWLRDNTDFPLQANAKEVIVDGKVVQVIKDTPASPAQAPIQNFQNTVYFDGYPSDAVDACKKARNFYDSMKPGCGSTYGWKLNQSLIDQSPLSLKQVKRIHKFLNSKADQAANPWSSNCDALLFHAWGAHPMMKWCAERINTMS